MNIINGYTQFQLNAYWASFLAEQPNCNTLMLVNDTVQVMSIVECNTNTIVFRRNNTYFWKELPDFIKLDCFNV